MRQACPLTRLRRELPQRGSRDIRNAAGRFNERPAAASYSDRYYSQKSFPPVRFVRYGRNSIMPV